MSGGEVERFAQLDEAQAYRKLHDAVVAEGLMAQGEGTLDRLIEVYRQQTNWMLGYAPQGLVQGAVLQIYGEQGALAGARLDEGMSRIGGYCRLAPTAEAVPGDHFTVLAQPNVDKVAEFMSSHYSFQVVQS